MSFKRRKIKIKKPEKVRYTEPKPIFSNKEIIFRSGGRAKVFNISSKLQVFVLVALFSVGVWSTYSYYMYNASDEIISLLSGWQTIALKEETIHRFSKDKNIFEFAAEVIK